MVRLRPNIPPSSPAATAFHRTLMQLQAGRVSGRRGPHAEAVARALRAATRPPRAPEDVWFERIAARRAEIPFEMAESSGQFAFGAPADHDADADAAHPAPAPAPGDAERLAMCWEVCRWASIPPVWGAFLLHLVRELRPDSCLELGTGLGLSGAHQAAALELNGRGSLITVDFHEAGRIAADGFDALGLAHRVSSRFGDIDEILGEVLAEVAPINFAFLDAEHSEAATVRHFDAVLPNLADGAVVVLDDITETDEMRRAWKTVISRPGVTLALPLRRVGVLSIGQVARA